MKGSFYSLVNNERNIMTLFLTTVFTFVFLPLVFVHISQNERMRFDTYFLNASVKESSKSSVKFNYMQYLVYFGLGLGFSSR